jgi:hypothetical protein
VLEELPAAVKKLLTRRSAPDSMEEVGSDSLADEVHVLLHLLDLQPFAEAGRGTSDLVEVSDIVQDLPTSGLPPTPITSVFPDLFEDPGIANAATTDH